MPNGPMGFHRLTHTARAILVSSWCADDANLLARAAELAKESARLDPKSLWPGQLLALHAIYSGQPENAAPFLKGRKEVLPRLIAVLAQRGTPGSAPLPDEAERIAEARELINGPTGHGHQRLYLILKELGAADGLRVTPEFPDSKPSE